MELNVKEWKEFTINSLFELIRGKTLSAEDKDAYKGNIPCINGSAENNGELCKLNDDIDLPKISSPALSLSRVGNSGMTFFQPSDFYVADNAFGMKLKYTEKIEYYLFLSAILNQELFKYSYGRTISQSKYLGTFIELPIQHNADGTPVIDVNKTYSDDGYVPDWRFMEDYIKTLYSEPITTKISGDSITDLDVDKWEEFLVGRLFTMLNGKGITKEEIELNKGDLLAIQSGEENNGVLGKISECYCREMNYTMTRKPCLTVARTGSAGFVSYQGEGCVVGDSAKILLLDEDIANVYTYMFLQTMLTANRFKYDYGRKVTESKYLNDILKLPIQRDDKGNPIIDAERKYSDKGYIPDWQFMEAYIKSLPYSDRI